MYFSGRASDFQVLCTNLLSFYSRRTSCPEALTTILCLPGGSPFISPADTHALRRDAAMGTAEVTGGWRSGVVACGLGEAVEMVRGSDEGYRRLGARKTRRGCGGGWRRLWRLGFGRGEGGQGAWERLWRLEEAAKSCGPDTHNPSSPPAC